MAMILPSCQNKLFYSLQNNCQNKKKAAQIILNFRYIFIASIFITYVYVSILPFQGKYTNIVLIRR